MITALKIYAALAALASLPFLMGGVVDYFRRGGRHG